MFRIDATCPDVTVTHDLIEEKAAEGFDIVYIGKRHHPEPEGAMGVAPKQVHLIETLDDVEKLTINNEKLLVTNQTTMSQWDVAHLMKALRSQISTYRSRTRNLSRYTSKARSCC